VLAFPGEGTRQGPCFLFKRIIEEGWLGNGMSTKRDDIVRNCYGQTQHFCASRKYATPDESQETSGVFPLVRSLSTTPWNFTNYCRLGALGLPFRTLKTPGTEGGAKSMHLVEAYTFDDWDIVADGGGGLFVFVAE
jgi:hypothetical protein